MRQRLFPNIQRMTLYFGVCIAFITVAMIISRLTWLGGMAAVPSSAVIGATPSTSESGSGYSINSKIQFAAADAKGNVLISNKEDSGLYIRVDIQLDETGRSVYYSGDIAPGTEINTARLQGELDDGTYECTAVITAYDSDTKEVVGDEKIPVTIYVGVKPDKSK